MPFERLIKYSNLIPVDNRIKILYLDNTTHLKGFFEERYKYDPSLDRCVLKLRENSHLYSLFQRDYICAQFILSDSGDEIYLYDMIKENVEILRYNDTNYFVEGPKGGWVNVVNDYILRFRNPQLSLNNTHSISTYIIEKIAFVKTNEFIGFVGSTYNKEYFKITPYTDGIQVLSIDEVEKLKVEYIYLYNVSDNYTGTMISNYLHNRYPVYAPYYTAKRIYLGDKFNELSNDEIPIFPDMHIFPKLSEDTEFVIKKEGYMYMTVKFNK